MCVCVCVCVCVCGVCVCVCACVQAGVQVNELVRERERVYLSIIQRSPQAVLA